MPASAVAPFASSSTCVSVALRCDGPPKSACSVCSAVESVPVRAAPGAGGTSEKSGGTTSGAWRDTAIRSEEHTSELQSLMRISYAVFCLKKKKKTHKKD